MQSHAAVPLKSSEAVKPVLQKLGVEMLVLESSQRTAFGFLHLTRSPRHGMHSSARQSVVDA